MYNKLYYWIKENQKDIVNIPLSSIFIKEDVHKEGEFHIPTKYTKIHPIIVKNESEGKYSLIANWYAYKYYKEFRPRKDVPVIIIEENRETFLNDTLPNVVIPVFTSVKKDKMNSITIKLNKINIPEDFRNKQPKSFKIENAIKYYKNNGCFDKLITIDGNKTLVDGYARYLAAVALGLKSIPVIQKFN